MLVIDVYETTTDKFEVSHELFVDGEKCNFDELASQLITGVESPWTRGIFCGYCHLISFSINDITVMVDFGGDWNIKEYDDVALEIVRRADLVKAAFAPFNVPKVVKYSATFEPITL